MHTYRTALGLVGASVPAHLVADAEVPILTGPQAQGDLMVIPFPDVPAVSWEPVPDDGVQLVRGEATGNTHWLHRGFDSPGVRWAAQNGLTIAYVLVPKGQSAQLIHTDEHGANGIGPGIYRINRKREQAVSFERPRSSRIRFVED
jgi:hypothetical protein